MSARTMRLSPFLLLALATFSALPGMVAGAVAPASAPARIAPATQPAQDASAGLPQRSQGQQQAQQNQAQQDQAQQNRARPVILVYHQVGVTQGATLSITPQQLRERVIGLQALGYRFVTASQAARAAAGERVAVIQFDDGFASVYESALPVLRSLGVPGTAFVITGRVGQPGHMTPQQLRELQGAGWEVGHHTVTHAPLPRLTPPGIRQELSQQPALACVSYPYNRQDARVRRVAREQGLGCGVSGGPWTPRTDPLALPAPALTAWDDRFLAQRARWGVGGRTPLFAAAAGWALLPGGPAAGADAAALSAPLDWNPATYELLGNGSLGLRWRGGERETQWAARWGGDDRNDWTLHAAGRRGAGGGYSGFGVAYHRAPYSVGVGWDSAGPLLSGGLALGGYGELWGRWHPLSADWALGTTLIPADHWRLTLAHSPQASEGWVRYALPYSTPGTSRPLELGLGYARNLRGAGTDHEALLGVSYALGSYELGAEVGTRGRWGVQFRAVW